MKSDVPFESSGLSPEEADRLAASFKPSWEFDDAPFTQASTVPHSDMESLEAGGVNSDVRGWSPDSQRSQNVAAHAPPQRVETNEPEVSVIIDRSITAAEMARAQPQPPSAPPPPMQSPFAAQMAAAAVAPNRVVAPVARSRMNADESLELPASLKKSNKGLFIGLGAALAAAVVVFFAVRAATSSASDDPAPSAPTVMPTPDPTHASSIPEPPAPATQTTPASAATSTPTSVPVAPPPKAAPVSPPTVSVASLPPAHATPPPAPPKAAPKPAPAPHHPPPPRPAPKQPSGGGIVRDNPF